MKLVENKISVDELKKMSEKMFGSLVKAVVDIEKEIMVVDAELHSDEEELLLENESNQENLWGINLYPEDIDTENWIEFDSMINIRPSSGNRSCSIEDPNIRKKIITIVNRLVTK
ncbi:hypothetical protein GF322_05515 [Candidatus Dependentiae bacterium]|nr:hypothetical protein [Candidatus Dependentiae bacterium]